MPDIGATLREARMRARIDITEIEARDEDPCQVSARARERGVGPAARARRTSRASCAPTPTRSGSTASSLVEEYKLRHERLQRRRAAADRARPAQRDRRRAAAARRSRAAWLVASSSSACWSALWLVGNRDGNDGATRAATPPPTTSQPSTTHAGTKTRHEAEEGRGQAEGRAPDDRRHRAGLRVPEGGRQAPRSPGIVLTGGAAPAPRQVLALPPAARATRRRG